MDVTILICTYNSAARLPETLGHLARQVGTENLAWEVLIVDYLSTDGTEEAAYKNWPDQRVPLRVIKEEKAGKTPALETGLRAARGEAVCILDDDNWADPHYVYLAHKIISEHPDVGVIGAFGEPHCEVEPPPWFYENLGTYAVGPQGAQRGYVTTGTRLWFWGAGSVFRREAWLKAKERGFVPIFNPSRGKEGVQFSKGFTGGEDPEMCYAVQLAGYRLWYEPDLKYQHYIPKGRLEDKFLENATTGTAAAQPILRIYLAEVLPASFTGRLRKTIYKNWFLHSIYVGTSFIRATVKSALNKSPHKTVKIKKLYTSFRSQEESLWELRSSFKGIVTTIESLKM